MLQGECGRSWGQLSNFDGLLGDKFNIIFIKFK